jgi:hypothetical protein
MQTKKKVLSSLLVVVFSLFTGLAMAAGDQKIALKADKAGKGASGTAVIVDKGGDQKEVAITAKGLKPNSVYTVWLVNMKPKMDMAGLGGGRLLFQERRQGECKLLRDDRLRGSFEVAADRALLSPFRRLEKHEGDGEHRPVGQAQEVTRPSQGAAAAFGKNGAAVPRPSVSPGRYSRCSGDTSHFNLGDQWRIY